MTLVTLIVFAAALGGVVVLVSRGMKVVVCGAGIALMVGGLLLPVRMGDGGMAAFTYVSAKAGGTGDSKFSLIFDAVGDGKMSIMPVLALLVAIAAALLLLYGFTASMRRRDPDETPGPMIATVMAGLSSALLLPLSIMAYRELRHIHGGFDSPAGFLCFLVFELGVIMTFFGTIMTARSLPSVPARIWPHREF
jgi:hypothetical protein